MRSDFGFKPFAAKGDGDEETSLNKEVDAHEGPDLDEGEIEEGVVNGDPDDAE